MGLTIQFFLREVTGECAHTLESGSEATSRQAPGSLGRVSQLTRAPGRGSFSRHSHDGPPDLHAPPSRAPPSPAGAPSWTSESCGRSAGLPAGGGLSRVQGLRQARGGGARDREGIAAPAFQGCREPWQVARAMHTDGAVTVPHRLLGDITHYSLPAPVPSARCRTGRPPV